MSDNKERNHLSWTQEGFPQIFKLITPVGGIDYGRRRLRMERNVIQASRGNRGLP